MEYTQMKTYLIEHDDGTRRKITVPASWKVTFGPAVAGKQKGSEHFKMPMALRFYESKEQQRAIFTDVVSFRDTSIDIQEERVSTQEKEGFIECDGVRKSTTFKAETKEWVNPDNLIISHERILPPCDEEMFGKTKTKKQ